MIHCAKRQPLSEATKEKIRQARIREWASGKRVYKLKQFQFEKGHSISEEMRKKQIAGMRAKGVNQKEKHWNWKGGVNEINNTIRKGWRYKEWRKAVFERDDYTCQECGQRGGYLQADHIKPFAYFEDLRYEVSNGRTLCIGCHRKTDTFGQKARKLPTVYLLHIVQ